MNPLLNINAARWNLQNPTKYYQYGTTCTNIGAMIACLSVGPLVSLVLRLTSFYLDALWKMEYYSCYQPYVPRGDWLDDDRQ